MGKPKVKYRPKLLSIPILNNMYHSEETERILKPYVKHRRQSEFIRNAIIDYASKQSDHSHGMNVILANKKPDYISSTIWLQIIEAHEKTHYIKYGYVIAFFWLLSLSEFKNYNKSKLMREIILAHQ